MDKKSTRETRGIPAEILQAVRSCRSILTRFADRLNGSLRDYDIRLPEARHSGAGTSVCLIAGRASASRRNLATRRDRPLSASCSWRTTRNIRAGGERRLQRARRGGYAWITSHEYLEEVLELAEWHAPAGRRNLPWRPAPPSPPDRPTNLPTR